MSDSQSSNPPQPIRKVVIRPIGSEISENSDVNPGTPKNISSSSADLPDKNANTVWPSTQVIDFINAILKFKCFEGSKQSWLELTAYMNGRYNLNYSDKPYRTRFSRLKKTYKEQRARKDEDQTASCNDPVMDHMDILMDEVNAHQQMKTMSKAQATEFQKGRIRNQNIAIQSCLIGEIDAAIEEEEREGLKQLMDEAANRRDLADDRNVTTTELELLQDQTNAAGILAKEKATAQLKNKKKRSREEAHGTTNSVGNSFNGRVGVVLNSVEKFFSRGSADNEKLEAMWKQQQKQKKRTKQLVNDVENVVIELDGIKKEISGVNAKMNDFTELKNEVSTINSRIGDLLMYLKNK